MAWSYPSALVGISAAECASAMFHELISHFGVPVVITSDRDTQFTSSLWSAICSLLNIKHKTITAFHPQSNGIVERFHRQLKNSLGACLASSDWFVHLPWVLLGLRSVPREDSASEAVYGSKLTSHISSWQFKICLPTSFMKISGIPCPISVLFWLVTIFRQFQISQSSYQAFSCPVWWFLFVRTDMFLP